MYLLALDEYNYQHCCGPPRQSDPPKNAQALSHSQSTLTNEVVNFYDQLHEVSPMHLLTIMPFDAMMLCNCFKGHCIPSLGVVRYAAMGRTLMESFPTSSLGGCPLKSMRLLRPYVTRQTTGMTTCGSSLNSPC